MSRACLLLISSSILLTTAVGSTNAHAQARRVFVAGQGSDSNPCTFALPCRSFNRAASVVAPGGEIDVLDPAGYGSVSITKSLSIQGHGFAGISPAAAPAEGVVIAAGPNDRVSLHGLIIDGLHLGATGIDFQSAGSLIIENSVVRNWVNSGIAMEARGDANIYIGNTVVSENGSHGIYVQPPNQSGIPKINAAFNRVEVYKNGGVGIGIYGNYGFAYISAYVTESVASSNGLDGFYAIGFAGTTTTNAFIALNRSVTAGTGVHADERSSIYIFDSYLPTGWSWSGSGCITTSGNNSVKGPAPCQTYPLR